MTNSRILVVGTTADYIEYLYTRFQNQLLFITDFKERVDSERISPDITSEVLCELSNITNTALSLGDHIKQYDLKVSGVVCFDCESLNLAAKLADIYNLKFTSAGSVDICRSKYISHLIWDTKNVCTPKSIIVETAGDLIKAEEITLPLVIKPTTGSGSELIFKVDTLDELENAYNFISQKLIDHSNIRMYKPNGTTSPACSVEEFITGREYSCDFIIENNRITIIRTSEKLISNDKSFATAAAYITPANLPFEVDYLKEELLKAAKALGVNNTPVMCDFIVHNNKAYFIEMTPRIGGDCLPFSVKYSIGKDTRDIAIDYAKDILPEYVNSPKKIMGIRIIAEKNGIFETVDTSRLNNDKSVLEISINVSSGHNIIMPPDNYDSRILGHVIINIKDNEKPEQIFNEINKKIRIVYRESNEKE